jgi:starch synthase
VHNYSEKRLSGKEKVKNLLQKECGFKIDGSVPIVGMVGRLVDQKGIGPLCGPTYGSLFRICNDLATQVVILGSGESWCEKELRQLESVLPNLRVYLEYNNRRAHLIEGGADFFLMPSKYEPCGLNQMYSLRYGTLPIAHNTGGLADTIENYNEETGEGTGFLFNDLSPDGIYDTVERAVWIWHNRREQITTMRKRGMKKRFTWAKSADEYVRLYRIALDRRRDFHQQT